MICTLSPETPLIILTMISLHQQPTAWIMQAFLFFLPNVSSSFRSCISLIHLEAIHFLQVSYSQVCFVIYHKVRYDFPHCHRCMWLYSLLLRTLALYLLHHKVGCYCVSTWRTLVCACRETWLFISEASVLCCVPMFYSPGHHPVVEDSSTSTSV